MPPSTDDLETFNVGSKLRCIVLTEAESKELNRLKSLRVKESAVLGRKPKADKKVPTTTAEKRTPVTAAKTSPVKAAKLMKVKKELPPPSGNQRFRRISDN